MRTARTPRAALVTLVLAVVAAAVVAFAGPAQAGGPTSVLLVAPGGGGTAALYYDDDDYAELARLLGADGSAPAGDTTGRSHESASMITVTWLIHDVSVWRVDRIYLGGPGGPWVGTLESFRPDVGSPPEAWHRPAEGRALVALLARLGLEPAGGRGGVAAQPQPEPAADASSPTRPAAAGPDVPPQRGTTPLVSWLLAGAAFLAGAALSAIGTLRLSRRRPAGPTDGSSPGIGEQEASAPEDWSPVEELASRR